jgi:ribosomal protein L40E
MAKTYPNLQDAGSMLGAYGIGLKFLGALCAILGVAFGIWFKANSYGPMLEFWPMLIFGGVFAGINLWVIGTFMAAIGESMGALADIATNSWGTGGDFKPQTGPEVERNIHPISAYVCRRCGATMGSTAVYCESCGESVLDP